MISQEDTNIANATSRSSGAVGLKAITPRIVADTYATIFDTILDFGAGKDAMHAQILKAEGYDITAYDFGSNVGPLHDEDALSRTYNFVYASNVINVQNTASMLYTTLEQIANATRFNGVAIMNFPASPRKGVMSTITTDELVVHLKVFFNRVRIIRGGKSAPVFECSF